MMGARAGKREDEEHRNTLPNPDTGFFRPDRRASVAVIGDDTDREHDRGR
jgi:hypothetical protein